MEINNIRTVISTPRFLDIEVTNGCNLRCKYCYHFESPGDVSFDLPTAEWLSFFREAGQSGIMSISISGGEPLIRKDLPQLIDSIIQNHMRFSLVTNATVTLISQDLLDVLTSSSRCDMIYASLDGSYSTPHDYARGKGSYEKTVAGIRLFVKNRLPTTVRMTIHKGNYHDIPRLAQFALDELKVDYFSANIASPLGLGNKNQKMILLNAKEKSQAISHLFQIRKKYGKRILNIGLVSDTLTWLKIQHAFENSVPVAGGGCLSGCGGVFSTLAVRADGVITPCVQLNHIELGRINKDRLSDVWQKSSDLNLLRTRDRIRLKDFEFCKGCKYVEYCFGGCPGLTYAMTGKTDFPNPETCLRRYLEEGGELPDYEE